MKTLSKVAILCGALALAGCKAEVEKTLDLSNLLDKPVHAETANLNVEIPSCENPQDSREPSDSLIRVKAKIPGVFKEAKYKECFRKQYVSYASFEIPVGVGNIDKTDMKKFETKDIAEIYLLSKSDNYLTIISNGELSKRIKRFAESELMGSKLDFNINIKLVNNTDKNQKFEVVSSYVNNEPVINSEVTLDKGKFLNVVLSNVQSDELYLTGKSGIVHVLKTIQNVGK